MNGFEDFKFIKMSGAGNTFLLVDNRKSSLSSMPESLKHLAKSEIARRLCSQHFGVGADGFVFLEDSHNLENAFRWDFYNSDGSLAQMCGNASRCVARYYFDFINSSEKKFSFESVAGNIQVELSDNNQVQVRMPVVQVFNMNLELRMADGSFSSFSHLNTGVPHLVQELEDISTPKKFLEQSKFLRSHHGLPAEGANVTYYSIQSSDEISAITFERGVEDFTLACGTGAVAAAYSYFSQTGVRWVKVKMPGGRLEVKFFENSDFPIMSGPATYIAEIKINTEALNVQS